MAQTGTVIPAGLNLRATPGGTIIKVLSQGATVQIIESSGDFLKVSINGEVGFVKAALIKPDEAPQPTGDGNSTLPTGGFRIVGNRVLEQDGTVVGRKAGLGISVIGKTTISQFVSSHSSAFTSLSPSRLRVMQAVSVNEGKLEAINTFDNAFLTFGTFQWTAGTGNGAGELPALINRLKQKNNDVFNQLFGNSGLGIASVSSPPGQPPGGFFSLNGTPIRSAIDKENKLRTLARAFQFYQAGHNDVMRQVEIEQAASRIDLFYRDASHRIRGRFIADYLTSEVGVALLLDEHVNRPGHVPRTLAGAVNQLVSILGNDNPASWTDQEERRLLELYIQKRNQTNMTDSQNRADRVRQAVVAGLASDKRGSFLG
jgi:Bacterial SH3 domain